MPGKGASDVAASLELLCATFNLGIGLVDGVCDENAEIGMALLDLVPKPDLARAAEEPRGRGWLRATIPPALAEDPTVAFTVEIIEAFFEMMHVAYPGDSWLQYRRGVGEQLGVALEAERQSVRRSPDQATRDQLIASSRLTSVLPFEIIDTLARGDHAPAEPSAGTLLGEAMWRIDDLVDLCKDVRSGAVNGVLLAATTVANPPGERDLVSALERLLSSTDIAHAAAEAAQMLSEGLHCAGNGTTSSFLYFIQRYADVAPQPAS